MAKKEAQELAYYLYMNGDLDQKEIARRTKVTEATLSRWADKGEWKVLKAANTVTRGQQIRHYLMQLKELNEQISTRESGKRYATPGESDTIKKITSSIKDLEKKVSLSEYITVFEEFIKYLLSADHDLAKVLIDYQNEFVMIKAKELS